MKKEISKIPDSKAINWSALKVEFFASSIGVAADFFRKKFKIKKSAKLPAGIYERMAGWSHEKDTRNTKIMESAIKDIEELEKKKVETIKTALSNLHQTLARRIGTKAEVDRLNYKEANTYWRILRTVIGEPTVVTKNTNINVETNIKKAKAHKEDALKKLEEEGLL